MRSNGKDGKESVKLSCYITAEEKKKWKEMVNTAALIEGIRNPDNGTYMSRIIRHELRLDPGHMAEYVKTHTRNRGQKPTRS